MAKKYNSLADVPASEKWDLSFLLEGKTPEEAMEDVLNGFKYFIEIKESKYDSSDAYLDSWKKEEEFSIKMNKFYNFLSNSINREINNGQLLGLQQRFMYEFNMLNQQMGDENSVFFENEDKLKEWAELPEFAEYKHHIISKLDTKAHKLPKEIEEYRIKTSRGKADLNQPFSLLTDSEMDYGYATTSTGKKIKITRANRRKLSKHKDKKVRKTAADEFAKANLKNAESLSNLLYQHFKQASVEAQVTNFSSAVEMLTYGDRVDDQFLQTLYKATQDNAHIKTKYANAYKKFYKARYGETATKYDMAMPLVNVKSEYSVDEAKELVMKALAPFGEEYNTVLKRGMDENWVDFQVYPNKRSGAYSIGASYGLDKKLILMNYDGSLGSVSTLAHEFGHSMHSYFSDENNNQPNSQYPIFLAEIASIFNQLMLNDYLLENSTNDKLKFSILEEQINTFNGTVFRQIEWSNYEYEVYKAIDQGQPVGSYDALSKIYYDVTSKYSTKKVKYNKKNTFPAFYVPHFYYGFYVYKYAIGQIVAQIFFAKYKQEGPEALQFYIKNFLSAGGSDHPINTLKKAGVDLRDPEVYAAGFKIAEDTVKEYTKLGNKIFKLK